MTRPIFHVVGSMYASAGGTAAVVAQIAARQTPRGPVAVLSVERPNEPLPQWPVLTGSGASLKVFSGGGLPLRSPGLLAHLDQHLNSQSILHLHGVWEGILWDAARIASGRNVPYVVSPHGMLDRWSRSRSRVKKTFAWWVGARRMIHGAGTVHCLTQHDESETAVVCGGARTVVVPTGVNPQEYVPAPANDGSAPGSLLFLARIHPKKGLDLLLRALARLPKSIDFRLIVAGPEEDQAHASYCRQLSIKLGLRDRLEWRGPVHGVEKHSLMQSVAAFVLPSHQEGFSVAVLEAMACGLPVVLSEQCRFPSVAERGAGFVVPAEPGALAAALEQLLLLPPAQLRLLGQRGRALVEEQFTWEKVTSQIDAVYAEIWAAAQSGRGRPQEAV